MAAPPLLLPHYPNMLPLLHSPLSAVAGCERPVADASNPRAPPASLMGIEFQTITFSGPRAPQGFCGDPERFAVPPKLLLTVPSPLSQSHLSASAGPSGPTRHLQQPPQGALPVVSVGSAHTPDTSSRRDSPALRPVSHVPFPRPVPMSRSSFVFGCQAHCMCSEVREKKTHLCCS